jgi:sugar O-acyltransferase (sialic acid O-acetyltransferase NeuD family)
MTHFVRAPLVNVNDDVMTLVEWLKAPGAQVRKGEALALLETTKATAELEAEQQGYFTPLVEAGAQVTVGQIIAALTPQPDEQVTIPQETPVEPVSVSANERPWTKKAEILAQRYQLDIEALAAQKGGTVTEQDVEDARAGKTNQKVSVVARDLVDDVYPSNRVQRLLILGAGRGAVQILDVLTRTPHQRCVGLLDDDSKVHGKHVMGYPVMGGMGEGERLWKEGVFDALVISISTSIQARVKLFTQYMGIPFANVIDPSALILSNTALGTGNVILALCHIGACTAIGNNNFMSARTHIEHHNVMGDHCTFGPGVFTSSRVKIGNRVKFGTGIFIEPGITIGDDAIVASGAVLTRHVPANTIVKVKTTAQLRERTEHRD